MRNFELPGRSLVMGRRGMAATSHPAATQTAVAILERGGNAMDAAIAAVAVQGVVEPAMTGIGGDCFVLYAPKGGEVLAFNGSGAAPAAATLEGYRAKAGGDTIPRQSPLAVTVPGAVDAWSQLLADHGTMGFSEVLAPAIAFARDGFAVAPRVAYDWADEVAVIAADEHTRRIYLKDGKAPKAGTVHRLPELAATLEAIADGGREAFYEGPVAEDMVGRLRALGGVHTAADFAARRGEYVAPIRTTFRGYDVYECPPNGQGLFALLILNILSGFEASGDPLSADRLQVEIEAARLAYAARDAFLADPLHAAVDVERLLSPAFAAELRAQIKVGGAPTALPSFAPAPHPDTVYLTVVDAERNAVSFINSIFHAFGSGITAPKSGVLLHSRGQGFRLEEGHPNSLAPGKRPLHTIIPGMVVKDGRAVMPFGVMGGQYQAMGHAHFLTKVLDFGLDPQAAMDLPRVFPLPGTTTVEAESTLPAATRDELARRGYTLIPADGPIGGAQAIWIDWEEGVLAGASEPRKDGCALGL